MFGAKLFDFKRATVYYLGHRQIWIWDTAKKWQDMLEIWQACPLGSPGHACSLHSWLREASPLFPMPGLPLSQEVISSSNSEIHLFSIWFIFLIGSWRSLLIKQIGVCVHVFKKGFVVVWQQEKGAVKLVTSGWKRYVWICDVDTRMVDLVRVATCKVDLGSKKVWHHCCNWTKHNNFNFFQSTLCINI